MSLAVESLDIAGVTLFRPKKYFDVRGSFLETFNTQDTQAYAAVGIDCAFVQDNQSLSIKSGTIRGLHFQRPPNAQAKLVRVMRGSIFDVAVDLRSGSPHFGRWCSAILTAEKAEQVFIPRGFAHGFCTLGPDTEVAYKVDGFYSSSCDGGLRWDDPDLKIAWPVSSVAAIVSDKDRLPLFRDFASPFSI
jgi:dTDP-4-dehydrorhamnose 3,5-epimerase